MQQFFSLLSWRLFTAQHVSGVFPSVIRSSMTAVAAFGFPFVSWWKSCCVRGRADRPAGPTTNTAMCVNNLSPSKNFILISLNWYSWKRIISRTEIRPWCKMNKGRVCNDLVIPRLAPRFTTRVLAQKQFFFFVKIIWKCIYIHTRYKFQSNTTIYYIKCSYGNMFRLYWIIIRPSKEQIQCIKIYGAF
jgi:hypothetical protein